jgi:hypothetical protein
MSKKRYQLDLPTDLHEQLQKIANEDGTTVANVIRNYVGFGLAMRKIANRPDTQLLVRDGDTTREIVFIEPGGSQP